MDFYNDYNLDPGDFEDGLPDEIMEEINPKKHRRDVLVEDCYVLSLADLGKGLLWPVNKWTEEYPQPLDEQIEPQGKQGQAVLKKRWGKLPIAYWVDLSEDPAMVNLSFKYRNSLQDQAICLGVDSAPYGMRPYLLCFCGYRANKLYLSPEQYSFMCRKCAGLYYESTTVNRNSQVGGLGYLLQWHLKLDKQKAKLKRLIYRGKITKRAERVLWTMGKYNVAAMAIKAKTGELQL